MKIWANFNYNFIETQSKSLKKKLRNLQKKLDEMSIWDWGTVEKVQQKLEKVMF